MTGWLWKEF